MKEENKKILSEYRMRRAWDTLVEAKILLESEHLQGAVNRIYYSVFYAVNALLIKHGMYSAKHSGVKSLFFREFVNKGLFKDDLGDIYKKIFKYRQKGDYEDFVEFKKEEVREWLKEAEIFVKEIKKVIEGTDAGAGLYNDE